MSTQQPAIVPPPSGDNTASDHDSVKSRTTRDVEDPHDSVSATEPALASREKPRMEGVIGDAILRFLRIRKQPKSDAQDLDAVRS